jgi:hypothetical protein
MSLNVSRTTEPLRFDVGIGQAGFAEIVDAPLAGQLQKSLLPGTTTVTQAIDEMFPPDRGVTGDVMRALVDGNPASLRTPGGFNAAARQSVDVLAARGTEVADDAAHEIRNLLSDTDLFEHYRLSLLET